MDPPPNNDNGNADDNNNNNNNNNVDNDAAVPDIAAAVVVDVNQWEEEENDAICQEALTLLQNRLTFHSRLRDRTMVQFARQFVTNVKEDIYQTITDTRLIKEGYDGLDSERDTEDEVATAIRCCPEVLSREDERFGLYPIQCVWFTQSDDNTKLVCNVKAVSFLPLFVQLAMEFNSFPNEERGGLLIQDPEFPNEERDGLLIQAPEFPNEERGGLLIQDAGDENVLHDLVGSSHISCEEEHHQRVDTTFLAVLIRLRRSGYFVKNDIQHYGLVHFLCKKKYFYEQRFQFLSEWDPASLLRTNVNNESPLHRKVGNSREFQVLLEAYFRYYPRWKGLRALFTLNNEGETPFELACEALSHTKVMEVVEEILARYTTNTGLVNTNNNNDNNIGNAMLLAASEDTMSLDGLFFLIRRQPNTMLSMVRHRNNDNSSKNLGVDCTASEENGTKDGRHNKNNHNTGDTNSGDDHDSNANHNSVTVLRRSTRKRKR